MCDCVFCKMYDKYKWAMIMECSCRCHDSNNPIGHDSLCCDFPNALRMNSPYKAEELNSADYYKGILDSEMEKDEYAMDNEVLNSENVNDPDKKDMVEDMIKGVREELARYIHNENWSSWMKYLFSKCREEIVYGQFDERVESGTGNLIIPKKFVDWWKRQMNTDYDNLSEEEKKSDRAEADRIIQILMNVESNK